MFAGTAGRRPLCVSALPTALGRPRTSRRGPRRAQRPPVTLRPGAASPERKANGSPTPERGSRLRPASHPADAGVQAVPALPAGRLRSGPVGTNALSPSPTGACPTHGPAQRDPEGPGVCRAPGKEHRKRLNRSFLVASHPGLERRRLRVRGWAALAGSGPRAGTGPGWERWGGRHTRPTRPSPCPVQDRGGGAVPLRRLSVL